MTDFIILGVLVAVLAYIYMGGPGTATIRAAATVAWNTVKGWFGK